MKINNFIKVSLMMTAVAIVATSCNMSEMKEKRKEHNKEMKEHQEEHQEESQKKATEKNNKETLSPVQTGTTPD